MTSLLVILGIWPWPLVKVTHDGQINLKIFTAIRNINHLHEDALMSWSLTSTHWYNISIPRERNERLFGFTDVSRMRVCIDGVSIDQRSNFSGRWNNKNVRFYLDLILSQFNKWKQLFHFLETRTNQYYVLWSYIINAQSASLCSLLAAESRAEQIAESPGRNLRLIENSSGRNLRTKTSQAEASLSRTVFEIFDFKGFRFWPVTLWM